MKITSTQCQYPGTLGRLVYSSTGSCYFDSNHHGAEISVISLVEWSAIVNFNVLLGKSRL